MFYDEVAQLVRVNCGIIGLENLPIIGEPVGSLVRVQSSSQHDMFLMGEFASCYSSVWIEPEGTKTHTNLCTLK